MAHEGALPGVGQVIDEELAAQVAEAVAVLRLVYQDESLPVRLRVAAAKAALPFEKRPLTREK